MKKLLWSSAGLAALGVMIFGSDTWSYLTTAVSSVRNAVKSEVPLDFELKRAKELVQDLDGEVRKSLHALAADEVSLEELKKELGDQTTSQTQHQEHILQLRKDLQLPNESYVYAGKAYTRAEVQSDLTDRFERFKLMEETIKQRQQILKAREQAIAAARKKLDAMLDAKEQLQVQIENLHARMQTLEASQAVSAITYDDSHLSRTKQLLKDLGREIDVRQKLLNQQGDLSGLIPLETKPVEPQDVTQQIDQYFGKSPASETKPAASAQQEAVAKS